VLQHRDASAQLRAIGVDAPHSAAAPALANPLTTSQGSYGWTVITEVNGNVKLPNGPSLIIEEG
jgi:hypothetical protein